MNFIKKGKWLVFLLLLGLFLQEGWTSEKTQVFTGEGVAPIVNENALAARGEAIKKACINALERAMEEILSFEVIEEKRETIESVIYSDLGMYILGAEVLKEREEDGLYMVKIKATIDMDALKKIAIDKELVQKRGLGYRPRIMIVIPEQHLGQWIPDPAAETEIIKQFTKERFYVIDQSQVGKIRYNDETLAAAQGDSEAAAAIGRKYGAEVIITGEAFSEYVGQEKGMVLCSARVEIRAVKTDTAQILYADAKDISALAVSENIAAKRALQRTAGLLGPEFIEEILAWAEIGKEEGRMVTLYIPNISYSQLMIVKETLAEKIPRVDRSIQRSYTGGIGEIEVVYRGESQELADTIKRISFEDFNLEVTNFTENRIDCEIVKPAEKVAEEKITEEIETKKIFLLPKTFIMEGIWKLTATSVEFLPGRKNLQFNLLVENLQDEPAEFYIHEMTYLLDNLGNEYQVSEISPWGKRKSIQRMPMKIQLTFPELKEEATTVVLYLRFWGYGIKEWDFSGWYEQYEELSLGPIKLVNVPLIKKELGMVSLPQELITGDSKWKIIVDSYEFLERKLQFTLLIENLQEKIAECKINEQNTYLLDNLANEYHSPSTEDYKKLIPHMPVKFQVTFPELKEEVEVIVLYLYFKPREGAEGNWAVGPIKLEK